ncbi:Zinc transporter 2 [Merluccius polli]|uniref:Probable proton-coupled zinc antiporter SLC30A3 n=1 Tax=Merluccius polli TaxID=89951 RepID=A0AA47N8A7_MERPO|nr:Zinc transporter 2 [Merluccius polli]
MDFKMRRHLEDDCSEALLGGAAEPEPEAGSPRCMGEEEVALGGDGPGGDGPGGGDGQQQFEGHCHGGENHEKRTAKRQLLVACGVSLVFMIGEVIGGYAAQSLAIMADAAHLLTDLCSILISLVSLWISSRPPTRTMTFGWHRAEAMGALVSVLSIWAVTAVLVVLAGRRLLDGDYEIHTRVMLLTSGCAVGANVLMALILHQSGAAHGHSHALTSDPPGRRGKGGAGGRAHGNTSVRAAFVHALGDLLHSLGVLVAATIIHFRPEMKMADPMCTFLFSALVLATTFSIVKDVCRTLMEGTPSSISVAAVNEALLAVSGVRDVHQLHAWSLSGTHALVSVHVAIEDGADAQLLLRDVTASLRSEFHFSGVTVQVERRSEDRTACLQRCDLSP